MVDRRCLQHFCGQHFRIGLDSRVGVAFGTTLEQRYLIALAHPALGEGARGSELGRRGRILSAVHARAVEGNASDNVVERIAVQRHVVPRDILIGALHPKGIGERKATRHGDKVVTRGKAQFAHEPLDGRAVFGDLTTVDPVVDVYEATGHIAIKALDLGIPIVIQPFLFLVGGHHLVLVHQLIQHAAPPFHRGPIIRQARGGASLHPTCRMA